MTPGSPFNGSFDLVLTHSRGLHVDPSTHANHAGVEFSKRNPDQIRVALGTCKNTKKKKNEGNRRRQRPLRLKGRQSNVWLGLTSEDRPGHDTAENHDELDPFFSVPCRMALMKRETSEPWLSVLSTFLLFFFLRVHAPI